MEDSDWFSTYPTTAQPLPTMDTPLNFYLRCETHKVQLDTMASLKKHASLHNVQKCMRCEWTCGHCTHIFHSCIEMRRHLSLFSVRMGYAKTAEFATSQMVHKPYFRRKSHVFPTTTLQILASNARAFSIVPRYNALSSYPPNIIKRLATEAAELRKSSILHLPIHFPPISLAQLLQPDCTETSSLSPPSQPISSEDTSSEPLLQPPVDTTSTIQTSENLSHLQDIRLKLSQTQLSMCSSPKA